MNWARTALRLELQPGFDLNACKANLKLETCAGTIALPATAGKTDLGEVYADPVCLVTICELLYYNGMPHPFAAFEIIETQSSVSVKGVPHDPDRLS
jgi:hypothetical protein